MTRRLLVARAAGVGGDRGHIAEVRPVAHRGLYADLRGNAADGERHKPQVAHGHTEEGALEGAHGDLVVWGAPGGKGDTTSSSRSARCQAICCLSWETPMSSLGSETWRLKNTGKPPSRAAPSTSATLRVTSGPWASWPAMPACMS